ncbi:TPA: hypothetical protein RQJ47_001009 [Vibrio vulnificus]|nr:hypothetical protein [Vibrio vulnificus]HDY8207998.1 hypothetical protein [Vibrio vulnificus]
MNTYRLKGIAEGIVGASTVSAGSIDDVFEKYPELKTVRDKLDISGKTITGISACDG